MIALFIAMITLAGVYLFQHLFRESLKNESRPWKWLLLREQIPIVVLCGFGTVFILVFIIGIPPGLYLYVYIFLSTSGFGMGRFIGIPDLPEMDIFEWIFASTSTIVLLVLFWNFQNWWINRSGHYRLASFIGILILCFAFVAFIIYTGIVGTLMFSIVVAVGIFVKCGVAWSMRDGSVPGENEHDQEKDRSISEDPAGADMSLWVNIREALMFIIYTGVVVLPVLPWVAIIAAVIVTQGWRGLVGLIAVLVLTAWPLLLIASLGLLGASHKGFRLVGLVAIAMSLGLGYVYCSAGPFR